MAGLFAKAAQAAKNSVKETKRKGLAWVVGGSEAETVGKAIHELTLLEAQSKAIEAKKTVIKNALKRHCENLFITTYVNQGSMPDTPMTLQNADGEKITFVAQDRGGQYGLKSEQVEALQDLLGVDAAGEIVFEETSFGFSREILALPGVMPIIEKSLESAVNELVESHTLTGDQASDLLDVNVKTAFKPNTLDRLTQICGKDVSRVRQFLDIAASSFTRYVKS